MGGHGPRPKDPEQRVRRNKTGTAVAGMRVLVGNPVPQPKLPPLFLPNPLTGKLRRVRWPAATMDWWEMWGTEPLTDDFRATDWAFLADTALVHAAVWTGNLDRAGELRLRVAKLGATLEDRARLRITYAAADKAEQGKPESGEPKRETSRERYAGLSVVG